MANFSWLLVPLRLLSKDFEYFYKLSINLLKSEDTWRTLKPIFNSNNSLSFFQNANVSKLNTEGDYKQVPEKKEQLEQQAPQEQQVLLVQLGQQGQQDEQDLQGHQSPQEEHDKQGQLVQQYQQELQEYDVEDFNSVKH